MNAPTPQDQFAAVKGAHVEEQLDLPGIVSVNPAEAEADTKSAADASAYDADFLSLDELIDKIKLKKPELPDTDIESVRKLFESINERSNGKMGIPRTVEGAALDNADLALELHAATTVGSGAHGLLRKQGTVFGTASESGVFKMHEGAVFFHGKGGFLSSVMGNKSFTQEDARQIALLAMHNKDMLPPNAIKITGTKEQRAMIKAELDKLNEVLPQTKQFALTAKQEKELGALNTARPEAVAPAAPSAVTEARLAALAVTDKDAPVYEDTDAKYDLAESMSEALNEDRDGTIANAKPIGQLAKFGNDAYETTFTDDGASTTVQFADLGEDRGLKVIRIEPTDAFPGYQSTPYVVLDRTDGVELAADLSGVKVEKTPLAGNFDSKATAEPLTQSHPNFIGPREFVGPRQPAAAPTPSAP